MIEMYRFTESGRKDGPMQRPMQDALRNLCVWYLDNRGGSISLITPDSVHVITEWRGVKERLEFQGSAEDMTEIVRAAAAAIVAEPGRRAKAALLAVANVTDPKEVALVKDLSVYLLWKVVHATFAGISISDAVRQRRQIMVQETDDREAAGMAPVVRPLQDRNRREQERWAARQAGTSQ